MLLFIEIEKSFPALEKLFSKEELLIYRDTPIDSLFLYHFGLGLWIRNNLLYPERALYKLFIKDGISQPDDMSSVIVNFFHIHVLNKYK